MKKLLLLTMLLFSVTLISAQDFGVVGTKWYYGGNDAGSAPLNSEYFSLESVSDTVVMGKLTHKILKEYHKRDGKILKDTPIYLYQHSDTVFMYNAKRNKFLTLFIFNAKPGDTITLDVPWPEALKPINKDTTYRLLIDTVRTVLVDGVPLNRYSTTRLDKFKLDVFMDGIGGLTLFFPEYYFQSIEKEDYIRCFKDKQIDTSFQTGPCDYVWYTNVYEISKGLKTILFPNPGTGLFKLETAYPGPQELSICNVNGEIVYKATIEGTCEIDLSLLQSGVYVIILSIEHSLETVRFVMAR